MRTSSVASATIASSRAPASRKLRRSASLTSGSPGGDVVELAAADPVFELVDQLVEVLERVDDEQQRLVVVDLEVLVDHPLDAGTGSAARRGASIACSISPYELSSPLPYTRSASPPGRSRIRPNSTVNQKKRAIARMLLVRRRMRSCSSGIADASVGRGARALAEAHQRVGEGAVGVHRHVAGDVVEDVGLGQVLEASCRRGW